MTAPARTRRLVVVGASLAGLRVVEGARDAGFDGELTLIGDEPVAPYDRTVLSTRFLEDREEPQTPVYRPADDLRRDLDVDLRLGVAAHTLDPRSRTVHAGGHTIPYDALVIATGVRPRTPGWAANLAGVHLLRTVADARALRKSLARSRRVVVVGGGSSVPRLPPAREPWACTSPSSKPGTSPSPQHWGRQPDASAPPCTAPTAPNSAAG